MGVCVYVCLFTSIGVYLDACIGYVLELRIGGIFLPRNRPTLGPQVQSQSPELLD